MISTHNKHEERRGGEGKKKFLLSLSSPAFVSSHGAAD
jgi:hypothetical protein